MLALKHFLYIKKTSFYTFLWLSRLEEHLIYNMIHLLNLQNCLKHVPRNIILLHLVPCRYLDDVRKDNCELRILSMETPF